MNMSGVATFGGKWTLCNHISPFKFVSGFFFSSFQIKKKKQEFMGRNILV